MKIVMAGGSGHMGASLLRAWQDKGHELVVLSRSPQPLPGATRVIAWDGESLGPWAAELEGADAVINLAGRSVDCRYHARNLAEMLESRLRSTTLIGQAIAACHHPPRVWLQASTATLYAHRFDAPNDEATGLIGGDEPGAPAKWNASIAIARAWEEALRLAEMPHTRKVCLRTAMVMSVVRGSVFDVLVKLARRGLGGRIGDGRQFVSWIHEHDFVAALEFLLARDDITGPVNVCAPEPLPNAAFMQELRSAAGRRFGLSTPQWLLALGTWLLRTESELVLKSRRVVPGRLTRAGFVFRYPQWHDAVRELARRRHSSRRCTHPRQSAKNIPRGPDAHEYL